MLLRLTYPVAPIDRYFPVLSPQLVTDLTALAQEFRHRRVVHVNSTAVGGGVAEILQSMVPLMNALGIATERVVINPPPRFFQVTKRIHNLLQGAEGILTPEELEVYFDSIQEVADEIQRRRLRADVWFLHDPQLLPLASMLPREGHEVRLWVCHIDLTRPNESVLGALLPLTHRYDGLIFSLDDYVPQELRQDEMAAPVYIAPPAIDPLTAKNVLLDEAEAWRLVAAMGIDPERPLVTQVSRFDLWKDPWGVIDAYRLARQTIPGLQLALLGLSQAIDDPEALDVLTSVTEYAGDDPDIHPYFYPGGLPDSIDRIVNAFQVASTAVVQKSTREGFGLTVTEAMWKGKAVIGGNVGGIRFQIEDGVSGYLVNTPQECGQRIVQLVQDPALRARMGQAARDSVRQRSLLPRLVRDYLQVARDRLPWLADNHNGANGAHSVPAGQDDFTNGFEDLALWSPEPPALDAQEPVKVPVRVARRKRTLPLD